MELLSNSEVIIENGLISHNFGATTMFSIFSGSSIRIKAIDAHENIMGEVVLFDIYDTFSPVEMVDCNIYSNTIHLEEEEHEEGEEDEENEEHEEDEEENENEEEEEEEGEVDDFSLFRLFQASLKFENVNLSLHDL